MTIGTLSYPTIQPTLTLDFAKAKQLDPRVTFSRSSSGTYFDDAGVLRSAATNEARFDHDPTTGESLGLLVEEARTNAQTYSAVSTVGWNSISAGTAEPSFSITPDGTIYTATRITGSGLNSGVSKTNFTAISATYLATCYARSRTGADQSIKLAFSGTTGPTVVLPASGAWVRVSGTPVALGAGSKYIAVLAATSNPIDIDVWGLQAEVGSFPTSYIPTPATFTSRSTTATYYDASGTIQTAGIDVARDDAYFPDENGVMRPAGLLLEAAGTNLFTYSEEFNNGYNKEAGISVTPNTTNGPNGASTADYISLTDPVNSYSGIFRQFAVASGQVYTFSVFYKLGEITPGIFFTETSGAFIAPNYSKTETIGNGWKRRSITLNVGSRTALRVKIDLGNGGTWTGTRGVYLWGAQLETSPYPTSYIPTTTSTVTRATDVSSSSTVTRSADVAQITGTNFSSWYNQSEGTVFTEVSAAYQNGKGVWSLHTGTTAIVSDSIFLAQSSLNRLNFEVYNSSTQSTLLSTGILTSDEPSNRIAATYKENSFSVSYNGSTALSDSLGAPPLSLTTLTVGGRTSNTSTVGKTLISRLTYYPVRLPDATLQTLTS